MQFMSEVSYQIYITACECVSHCGGIISQYLVKDSDAIGKLSLVIVQNHQRLFDNIYYHS